MVLYKQLRKHLQNIMEGQDMEYMVNELDVWKNEEDYIINDILRDCARVELIGKRKVYY